MADRARTYECDACGGKALLHDVVDFAKCCEEPKGTRLPISGVPIYYARCTRCGFTFAPEMYEWDLEQFAARVYNDEYVKVDPDYVSARPASNARQLIAMLAERSRTIRHLDFGGGTGLLSEMLRDAGWNSLSYDPFVDRSVKTGELGAFDLVTAFEVFEHVPDVRRLVGELSSLLREDAVVLFTTLVSERELRPDMRITWWYASPRNGHISLFTRDALFYVADRVGLSFASFNDGFHAFWRGKPAWATFLPSDEPS